MEPNTHPINAVGAIRISSLKQGLQGDSPEAQKEQIDHFAKTHNLAVVKYFEIMESASKDDQPLQEVVDYCKNKKNNVDILIIKSIDRFTRGGSYYYDLLKRQLTGSGVKLIDIIGIIGQQDVNTLEHLGVEYKWSVYSPTKKSEILEAERAKDEMRDIMTRMIGAEIRYVRMGYRVRQPPTGYMNEKVETEHGKRVILVPHPVESVWIKKMFELRARGTMTDEQIVEEVNRLGFKSRVKLKRNPLNRVQIIGQIGGAELNLQQFWKYIQKPIYAGVNVEKWTNGQGVKGKFKGLVSIDTFNKANKGKITLVEVAGQVKIYNRMPPPYLVNKGARDPDFPYKRFVTCPICKKPLYGSASKGKRKYYPAYHCNRGHYWRVSKGDFEKRIEGFVKGLHITSEYAEALTQLVLDEWQKRQEGITEETTIIENRILELNTSARSIADKIRILNSERAIKYLEEDLVKIDTEITELTEKKAQIKPEEVNIEEVTGLVKYFLEHLEKLLLGGSDPQQKARLFPLLFEELPSYEDLGLGTPKLAPYIALNDSFVCDNFPSVNQYEFEWNSLQEYFNRLYTTFREFNILTA